MIYWGVQVFRGYTSCRGLVRITPRMLQKDVAQVQPTRAQLNKKGINRTFDHPLYLLVVAIGPKKGKKMVPEGLEPSTLTLLASRSNQLSYGTQLISTLPARL